MSKASLSFVILGESGVGKTSLADKVAHDTQYHHYDPFANTEGSTRMNLNVGSDVLEILIKDISLTPIRIRESGFVAGVFDRALREADGAILLYDITSEESYRHVTDFGWDYVWMCRSPGERVDSGGLGFPTGHERFGCTIVGNKFDLVQDGGSEKRQVPKELAEEWASMVGVNAFEVDRFDKGALEDVLRDLVTSINWAKRRDGEDLQVVKERERAKMEAMEKRHESTKETDKQATPPAKEPKQKSKTASTLSKLKGILPGRGLGSSAKA